MNLEELETLLKELYESNDERLRRSYNRSLPFQDGLFDRWERAARLGFAQGVSIYNSALVFGDIRVGRNTWIGPYTILDGSGGSLEIGEFCSISSGVHIYTHDTVRWALSGGEVKKECAGVHIGNCVYVGSQSVITAGVRIGDRCVVAANSFVNHDVPERTLVAGSPAQRIGMIEGDGAAVRIVLDSPTVERETTRAEFPGTNDRRE